MIDRAYLEAKSNWQATYRRCNAGVREPFDCLMRCLRGGYYWHTPDYQGLFAAGATRAYHERFLVDSLRRGYLELDTGRHPKSVLYACGWEPVCG